MSDCIFCKIIKKEIPSKIVYEDDMVIAFEDVNPQAPVHLLIVPRKHIPTLLDLTPEDNQLIGHIFLTANNLAKNKGISVPGFRTVFNCNKDAGQAVYHIHLHILGGRGMAWPPG
ncbi:MAG: histidine triad nucleotide-binding protein [Nitrospirota bacterium]